MSIKINKETANKNKNPSLNLVSIIEKYYLPKDISIPSKNSSNTTNLDTNLSDYLSLLSTSQQNQNKAQIQYKKNNSKELKKNIENNNKINTDFSKIFRNYIAPYFTLKDLISLKRSNKMFNFLIDKKAINNVL